MPPDDDDAPVTRRDLERGLRAVHVAIASGREDLLRLAAEVVALTEALTRRFGDEAGGLEVDVHAEVERVLAADERTPDRVELAPFGDKYATENADVPCAELLPICHAVCCKLDLALSTQDLDEGVLRWDYGRPYLIAHRASDGYCVHHDGGRCGVHAQRPAICREYSCRDDKRIWADFDRRILAAPVDELPLPGDPPGGFDLHARAQRRRVAVAMESTSLRRR